MVHDSAHIFVPRSPDALRAATEEVEKVLESTGQRPDPKGPRLTLTREQLDNLPVLGEISRGDRGTTKHFRFLMQLSVINLKKWKITTFP